MTTFNKIGLIGSRGAENDCRFKSELLKEGPIKSRLSHCAYAGGTSLYHAGKITARGFSLLNRTVETTAGIVGTVLTFGQSKKVKKFTLTQGLLLGSTAVHIVATPFQVASFAAGSVLGFAAPKSGAKLIGLSVKVDRVFDTFDNAVQGVDTKEVIREIDDHSVKKFAKKLRKKKIEVVDKDPATADKDRTIEDKIRDYLPSTKGTDREQDDNYYYGETDPAKAIPAMSPEDIQSNLMSSALDEEGDFYLPPGPNDATPKIPPPPF